MGRLFVLALLGAATLLVAAACAVDIRSDGTYKVYGIEPTPTIQLSGRVNSETGEPIYEIIVPTPVLAGNLRDLNITGAEYITPTATPRPTPTPMYGIGDPVLAGTGSLTITAFLLPVGRYNLEYLVSRNEENNYCLRHGNEDEGDWTFKLGCTSGATGDLQGERNINFDASGTLTIEIGEAARYRLLFRRIKPAGD